MGSQGPTTHEKGERQGLKAMKTKNTLQEVISKKIDQLKPGKAPGPDCITVSMLQKIKPMILTPLQMIFQKSLEDGTIPQD